MKDEIITVRFSAYEMQQLMLLQEKMEERSFCKYNRSQIIKKSLCLLREKYLNDKK